YDALDRLTSRRFGGAGLTPLRFDQAYDARGDLTTVTRYSDLAGTTRVGETDTAFDPVGRTTHTVDKDGSGATLWEGTYTYDTAGRLTTQKVSGALETYGYDATDQLTSDQTGSGTTPYSYDLNGNRTMSGYSVGPDNRLSNDGTWTYSYDAEGNRVKKSKGASAETGTYGYHERNQMSGAQDRAPDGGTLLAAVTITYDVFGDRIAESSWTQSGGTTTTTRFGYDGADVWADLDGGNALQVRYVRPEGIDGLAAR